MNRGNTWDILHVSRYDSKKLFVMFLIVIIAIQLDVGISNIVDIVNKQTVTFWGIVIFTIIAAIYILGQYFILQMVKAKIGRTKSGHPMLMH